MRSLDHAKQCARESRALIGLSPDRLIERLQDYLFDAYGIELIPVPRSFLEGGRAEVSPSEGCLFYDERLDAKPTEKLTVVAHEFGHLELHHRLTSLSTSPDPVLGSIYLSEGAPTLARYSPRSREEAEANAFATEFLCPSREVFRWWRDDPDATSVSIAQSLDLPVNIIRVQLAEALYQMVSEAECAEPEGTRMEAECDCSQLEAATFTGGPALVNAGPGTGKTATLVRRIEYLLSEDGASPESLLVLTFSNDAAQELRERIAARFGDDTASRIEIATFHGFGVSFLHHHGHLLGIDPDALILDETGQEEVVTSILGTVGCQAPVNLYDPEETVKEAVRHINYLKDQLCQPEQLAAALNSQTPADDKDKKRHEAHGLLELFRAYEHAKTARRCLDFADLIALPVRILDQHPDLAAAYHEKYRWVMVDEYQDVSRAVAWLLRQICSDANPPWVVGDTRQAIYRFRGSAPENVVQFHNDFPGARTCSLDTNYRSCEAIIRCANQLAALMEAPDQVNFEYRERWRPGSNRSAVGAPVITVARANSDQAEREGIAEQVKTWLELGVKPREIAVLARRNIDVRNIALTLGARGIRATTSGLITAEGATGDLAAVVTFVDRSGASLPRLVFSLGRGRFTTATLNTVIGRLLEAPQDDLASALDGEGEGDRLVAEIRRVSDCLRSEYYTGDAFTMMCAFLFDGSDYLRRLLAQPDGAERALALGEIMTALSKAAGYRFAHPQSDPVSSRIGFGQYFRSMLCATAPSLIAPRSTVDAVRVMTCHASKGLEFPCVIVAGQTLSQARGGYAWLPDSLQPSRREEVEQADALFFVGVTRAQRALLVSYAGSASGARASGLRNTTPLLARWHKAHAPDTVFWQARAVERQTVTTGKVWGGSARGSIPARTLDERSCAIRTYLEEFIGLSFPTNLSSLYPIFVAAMRLAMQRIVRQVSDSGSEAGPDEAAALFAEAWPEGKFADHPHGSIYRQLAMAYVTAFAHAFASQPKAGDHLDLDLTIEGAENALLLRLDLVAHYRDEAGAPVAIILRPESLAKNHRPEGLLWSGLKPAQRLSFVLLRSRHQKLQPRVFSAADGVLYDYLWTRKAADLEKETHHATERFKAFAQGTFETKVSGWMCDRCPVRVSCPYWMGALA